MNRRCVLGLAGLGFCMIAGPTRGEVSANRMSPLVKAIKQVRPAVVNIHSQKTVVAKGGFLPTAAGAKAASKMNGMGTGVIIDERGYIVTNYHVIEEVSSIRITLVDGASYTGDVIARDRETDLALLKIEPTAPLMVMPLGVSDDLMHGESVFAVGNAFGYEHTVTDGIISELHRDVRLSDEQSYKNLIQTDASINPGNSGGPLVNVDGQMIGLNVAIRAGAQGIGFAIPVNEVKDVVSRLLGEINRREVWHGLQTRSVDYQDSRPGRVIVERLDSLSPALAAGVKPGDRIIDIDGRKIQYLHDVERSFLGKRVGDAAVVNVMRDQQTLSTRMTLTNGRQVSERPDEVIWRRLGVRLSNGPDASSIHTVSPQLRGGLRIADVAHDRTFARAGLIRGDILVGIHLFETLSIENVVYILNRPLEAEALPVFYIRNGELYKSSISIPRD